MLHFRVNFAIFALVSLFTTTVFSQSCQDTCENYDAALVNCRNLYSSSVTGSGPIDSQAVNCVCVGTESENGFYIMSQCYKCNILTSGNLALLNDWLITCATNKDSGVQAAVECWNNELRQGNTGAPCFQGSDAGSAAGSAAPSAAASSAAGSVESSSDFGASPSSAAGSEQSSLGAAATSNTPLLGASATAAATSSSDIAFSTNLPATKTSLSITQAPSSGATNPLIPSPTTTAKKASAVSGRLNECKSVLVILFLVSLLFALC